MNTLDIMVGGFKLEVVDCPKTGAVAYHATFANGVTLVQPFASKTEEFYTGDSALAKFMQLAMLYANSEGDTY